MVVPAFAGGPPGDPPGLARAIAAQEAHTDALLARPGIVGTAVGLGADGQAVVVIYTESAGVGGLPTSLDGVKAEPVVTGLIVARTDPTAWQSRPVPVGVSIGHPDITAGTIGARVTDGTDVFALSNNHVLAAANGASIGDGALQPGTFDGGTDPTDRIGDLFDFEPIMFDGSDNTIDAAIALSSTADLGNATPSDDGYGTPNSTPVSAMVNQGVQKYGRTTGLTTGQVSEINVTVNVCYQTQGPVRCKKLARFVDQIAITAGDFSAGGDSGSLIVTNDTNANPVGLLFAGSSTRTFANRIDLVLNRFSVTVDTSAAAPPAPVAMGTVAGNVTETDGTTAISGASVVLEGTSMSATTDAAGDYEIGNVPEGTYDVTASATGFASETTTGIGVTEDTMTSVGFALAVQTSATTVSVSEITYATEGGKSQDKHLLMTVALVDDMGNPVGGATVSVTLTRAEGGSWNGTATTGTNGTLTFTLKNAQSGTYTTAVTDVTAAGLTWDGVTPSNSFTK